MKTALKGKVYLVGAGVGDPEWLTLKAYRLLREADIVYHDRLVHPDILKEIRGELHSVGKRRGMAAEQQREIQKRLCASVRSGKTVVRLKGGDPLIFGRAGEEISYLQEQGIDVEIVPAITTATAVCALAGFSMTQRGISSSIAFCTAQPEEQLQIPNTDTIVFYMCAANLSHVAKKCLEQGRKENTPIFIAQHVGYPQQRFSCQTLKEVSEEEIHYEHPLLAIVGQVVSTAKKRH